MRWPRWRRLLIVAAMVPCLGAAMLAQTSIYVLGRGGVFTTPVFFPDGTASAPSISFATDTDTGFYGGAALGDGFVGLATNAGNRHLWAASEYRLGSGVSIGWSSNASPSAAVSDTSLARGGAAGKITLTGTTPMFQFGGTSASFAALKGNGSTLESKVADDSGYAGFNAATINIVPVGNSLKLQSVVLISTTAPTISSGFGTSPSIVNSNGTAAFIVNVGTGGVATSGVIGLPAATTGWSCFANDRTTNVVTRQTATTTTTATFTAASAWTASDILNISCFAY